MECGGWIVPTDQLPSPRIAEQSPTQQYSVLFACSVPPPFPPSVFLKLLPSAWQSVPTTRATNTSNKQALRSLSMGKPQRAGAPPLVPRVYSISHHNLTLLQASPAPPSQHPHAVAGTMCPCCGTSASLLSGWPPCLGHKKRAKAMEEELWGHSGGQGGGVPTRLRCG